MDKRTRTDILTDKQKRFAEEYMIDLNAKQAAIRSGYSVKTAESQGSYLLSNPKVKAYIDVLMQKHEDSLIMSAAEVLKALTASARGETTEEVVIVEGIGQGVSSAKTVTKAISERDRLKALELLGKRHALFTDKVDLTGEVVVFQGEDKLQD